MSSAIRAACLLAALPVLVAFTVTPLATRPLAPTLDRAQPPWPGACPEHFWQGRAPVLTNPRLADRARPLCAAGFAVLHSGRSRGPLYAAEHLTRERVRLAREVDRVSEFREDDRLPPDERADLSDYVRSGYDRGHMAPSGDMPDLAAQAESFTLANVVPQNPTENRNLWSDVETAVRRLTVDEGEAYVMTGPIFEGADVPSLRGRVLVPTLIFKAVYLPGRNLAGAYLVQNDARADLRVVSVDEVGRRAGLDLFPGLPDAVRTVAAPLPEPRGEGPRTEPRTERRPRREDTPWEGWFAAELRRALWRAWRDFWRSLFR
jgi:endonuclease G, mitochondrial